MSRPWSAWDRFRPPVMSRRAPRLVFPASMAAGEVEVVGARRRSPQSIATPPTGLMAEGVEAVEAAGAEARSVKAGQAVEDRSACLCLMPTFKPLKTVSKPAREDAVVTGAAAVWVGRVDLGHL